MRRYYTSLVLVVVAMLLVSVGLAQQAAVTTIPNLIRYGGTLKDAQGAPVSSTTAAVTFAIYKQQDGGAPVWMETQNVPTDAGGNYSVLLGNTTATGLLSDLFSQQEQRWLGVQVQGETEQPRVLMVSVPYAFKAHEAETLGGRSVSDFVLAREANSPANVGVPSRTPSSIANNPSTTTLGKESGSQGPTNFSGETTDQIVRVTQSGAGMAVNAVAGSKAIYGTATNPTGAAYGVEGVASGASGIAVFGSATSASGNTIGVRGSASSTTGTALRGFATATTGATTGVSATVSSPAGIAAAFNNAKGGKIISGQNNAVEVFSVDGFGNVSAAGKFSVISNGISSGILSIGSSQNLGDDNLWVGSKAGTGSYNAFGINNTGVNNVLAGANAGIANTNGSQNTFLGTESGMGNTSGRNNVFLGYQAGFGNTTGIRDTFVGDQAGVNNSTGNSNVYVANEGPMSAESNTIRIGTQGSGDGQQDAAFIAGIYGASVSSGKPVFVDSTGKMGISGGTVQFSQLSGTLANSQLRGTYSNNAVTLSNSGNSFTGNGAGLTGVTPGPGSPSYIQNGTTVQTSTSYNIDGSGTLGGPLTANAVNSATAYDIGGASVLSVGASNLGSPVSLFLGLGTGNDNQGYGGNTFVGTQAGFANAEGSDNTFIGAQAGDENAGGSANTFVGYQAGYNNGNGGSNTFVGYGAGYNNTGDQNILVGLNAGLSNHGENNVFIGNNVGTGGNSGSSSFSTFVGHFTGLSIVGSANTFYGFETGINNITGNNDIYIGNPGCPYPCTENNTIRIGGDINLGYGTQTAAYIAGIYGSGVNGDGTQVLVDSNGALGTFVSSRRFKEQIVDMGDSTNALMKLRPVTFLYKPEFSKDRTLQYGLIAEEVAEVYPELVAYDNDGKPYTVRYQYLNTMLLNEVQKQYRRSQEQTKMVATQQSQIESQQRQIAAQQQQIEGLNQQLQLQNATLQERLSRLEGLVRAEVQTVAQTKP